MIDLHTHTLFSDGVLLPSELVRRAEYSGYKAIAITDHVDASNIDFVVPRIVKVCKNLNRYWKIKTIPGVEITHVPLQEIPRLVGFARKNGAKIIVGHGETVCEPVLEGTNMVFIGARVDILAHPGRIKEEDVALAKKNNVCLEVTTRKGHSEGNGHVIQMARKHEALLVLNNDAHTPEDLLNINKRDEFLRALNIEKEYINEMLSTSARIVSSI